MINEASVLLEQLKEFLSVVDKDAAYDFLRELLFSAPKFLIFVVSISLNFFILLALFNVFLDGFSFLWHWLDKRYARKKFKERYVQNNPYEIIPICSTNSQKEKYMVSNWTPKNQFSNEISCNNEENARLICTIMNCDNEHKKFNIKAYQKGLDIEKLKALEGQEEK